MSERSFPWGEPRDDDYEEESDGYCQCGAYHEEGEADCGICSCCGLPVDPNDG